jgi:hypothetical protein
MPTNITKICRASTAEAKHRAIKDHRIKIGGFDGDTLLCPYCGNEYLHHSKITAYDRSEDATAVTVSEIERGVVTRTAVLSDAARNPSSRRDGIAIEFWCENCHGRSELTIAQHKRCSLCDWRVAKEDNLPANPFADF